ncbi:outer membrane beta-barrel protein [Dyella marensis]|uniref:Outer membrane immunogenic protein n=1 Tax=Dyella marensis TaxID=500610 RepID=A0A1I2JJN8_9GAMM|nr:MULTISPECIES: outer membrane beta-barrel protein [Dyella]SFF53377.1 outer membrane immunogenic protein [Dyella marensis]
MTHWISKTALAVAMVTSGAAMAADGGQFFVNGQIGSQKVSTSKALKGVKKNELIGTLRAGYMWNNGPLSYGAETGYVVLGSENGVIAKESNGVSPRIVMPEQALRVKTNGWLFGGNAKLHIGDSWFVSGRGGLFRSNLRVRTGEVNKPASSSHKSTKNGYYAGVGAGYDFNEHFGLGANFDYYRARVNLGSGVKTIGGGYEVYGVTAEYRL